MTTRNAQREATRARILQAAIKVFTEKGFHGASTRDIAAVADTNQGLITYHFSSKDELWRAAAQALFEALDQRLQQRMASVDASDPSEFAREAIREYVRYVAEHPELIRLMIDEGKVADERMRWLVDNLIRPRFDSITPLMSSIDMVSDDDILPHAFYALAGAASLIFAVAPECQQLTGRNPQEPDAVETHADFVANLLIPPGT